MGPRTHRAFKALRARAREILPWLAQANLRSCSLADLEHRKKWRQFAHSNHYPMTVCFARAAESEMTDTELLGMGAHELGHLAAIELKLPAHMAEEREQDREKTPQAVQDEADWVARTLLGIAVTYNERTLQDIA